MSQNGARMKAPVSSAPWRISTVNEVEKVKSETKAKPAKAANQHASSDHSATTPSPKRRRKRKLRRASRTPSTKSFQAKYPRHSLSKVLRVPKAILDQNAGQPCSEAEAASFVGVGFAGPFRVEVSSAIKYRLMERPSPGRVALTERARQILRPQKPEDEIKGMREAALDAPDIGEVYQHSWRKPTRSSVFQKCAGRQIQNPPG
jgi:hypothetical protein